MNREQLVVHGDGVTDDTEALQAFLDGKADLVFPDGTPFGARSRKCIDPSWGLHRFHTTKPLIMRNTEDN